MPLFITLLLLLFSIIFPPSTYAKQGCCSWHSGVCGSSCCDGTPLSAKCGGGGSGYSYTPRPIVYTPQFPMTIQATPDFVNYDDGTIDINVTLSDDNPTQYSAVISKYPGSDPGPTADFFTRELRFSNITPGTWYLNVKKLMNGQWSTVTYYKLEVPEWVAPEPTPTDDPKLFALKTKEPSENYAWLQFGLIGIGIIAGYELLKNIVLGLADKKKHHKNS